MITLTPERAAELERWREETRNGWRIAEKCGDPPNEADRVWDMLRLEAKFYCSDFKGGQNIAYHGKKWIETKNPFHIDSAVMLCGKYDCPILPSLEPLVQDVAKRRLLGEYLDGTRDKILREGAYDKAYQAMAWLRAAGATIDQAAAKAAHWLAQTDYPLKASVLARNYSANCRVKPLPKEPTWCRECKTIRSESEIKACKVRRCPIAERSLSIEEKMIRVWNSPEYQDQRNAWYDAVWALPDASEDKIGTRR